MKNIIHPVKGTRDFYPEEMAIRNWFYQAVRKVSESFGYQEYEGPILETLDLYAAKSSEELVKKQSFSFEDRGGDWITLRPELTPTLARMIAQRQRQLSYPLRLWSYGPFWRYEKPQKGRTREFFQWNIDLIGVDSPQADAEMVAIAATFLKEVKLTPQEVAILINDRQMINQQMDDLGLAKEMRPEVLTWMDRRDKLPPANWEAFGLEIGLTPIQLNTLKNNMDDKNLWQQSEALVQVFDALEALGCKEYVRYDPNIIRGLPYYTGVVFEAFDVRGNVRRAILGGGRYNNLMAAVGGEPLPATGFAMGDVVISLILKELGRLPTNVNASPASILVTVFDNECFPASLEFAAALRHTGINTNCYPNPAKLSKQFKYADRMGMRAAIVIGPDEAQNNRVTIKDLQAGHQQTYSSQQALQIIVKMLQE